MQQILWLENSSSLVFVAIVASIILAFFLLVVVFAIRFKAQQEKQEDLREQLQASLEKVALLEESLREVQIINAAQSQEIRQFGTVTTQLGTAKERIETLNAEIVEYAKKQSELEATLAHTQEALKKAEEGLDIARKRNEFWVEQTSELRTKYEAVKTTLEKIKERP